MKPHHHPSLPVRRPESETLELKSLDVLADPETIARAAVAMLNASGGSIWIGIKEAPRESPSGNEIQPLAAADAERQRRRLQDHLLDVIEPTPTGPELGVTTEPVEAEPSGSSGRVLQVRVTPAPGRRPYAFLRHMGRHFVRRVGDRTVPMSRDELREAFGQAGARGPETGVAAERLLAEARDLIARHRDRFWLGLEPASPGDLDLRKLRETELLEDPTASGTLRNSYNFTAAAYHGGPRLGHAGNRTTLETGSDSLALNVFGSGGLQFRAALAETFRSGQVPFVNAERLLSPEALLGYPVSVFRLAGTLLGEDTLWRHRPGSDWMAALAISDLHGWGLLPGDLPIWPRYGNRGRRFVDEHLLLQDALRFTEDDLRQRPESCAMRLVERIYDAFEIDLLPTLHGAALVDQVLPAVGQDGYSRWVSIELHGGVRQPARLRRDNLRPSRYEWETRDGSLIPADGRWVLGWS